MPRTEYVWRVRATQGDSPQEFAVVASDFYAATALAEEWLTESGHPVHISSVAATDQRVVLP